MRNLLRGRKKYFLIAFLIFLVLGWLFFIRTGDKEEIKIAKAERKDVVQYVSASGVLDGGETANLRFQLGGRLVYLGVKEGDTVLKNQLVAALDSTQASISLQQAKNTLRDKEASLEKIYDDVKGHEKDETFVQKQTRTTAEVAKDNAYDSVRSAEKALKDTRLSSPLSGIVTKVDFVVGQNISAADVIIQVSDNRSVYFDAEVDEADVAKVTIGQKAQVTLNTYPDKVLSGKVEKIVPNVKTTSSGATAVVARVNLGTPDIIFVPGVNGQAEIITQEAKASIAAPQEALVEPHFLYVAHDGKYEKREVKAGLLSDTDVQILEGLTEGEEVVVNPELIRQDGGIFSRLGRK